MASSKPRNAHVELGFFLILPLVASGAKHTPSSRARDGRVSLLSGSRLAGASVLKPPPSYATSRGTALPASRRRSGPLPVPAGSSAGPASSRSPLCAPMRPPSWSCRLGVTSAMRERRLTCTRSSLRSAVAPHCSQAVSRRLEPARSW